MQTMSEPTVTFEPDVLAAIFGDGLRTTIGSRQDLAGLAQQFVIAEATSGARQAAFLTAIAIGSGFAPDAEAPAADGRYRARGFLQLHGIRDYRRAGDHFDVDLVNQPHLAADRAWSAKLARWRWLDRVPMEAVDDHDLATVLLALGLEPHDPARAHADYRRALAAFGNTDPITSSGG